MFNKILIANRGEIACRVAATARRLGVATVAVFSQADANAAHVRACDQALAIGASPAKDSYLLWQTIIAAAKATGAQAIHPGYGFLSENQAFAQACQEAGLVFIGPPAAAINAMGLKAESKRLMAQAGVPLVPGYHGEQQDAHLLQTEATRIGYPVLIKASAGGGGKGMRVVEREQEFAAALASCQREAQNSFGNAAVLIERYVQRPRHIEIQVFADQHGNVVHLFERDCSVQRRHQKVLEESPAPGLSEAMRERMGQAAIAAARAVGYVGAGTVEFIVEQRAGGAMDFFFMEMNTRLQVEHPVTEAITGLDLVEWQLRVAAGEPLPLSQAQITRRGHAVEARICAENPEQNFLPATGTLHIYRKPAAASFAIAPVRLDDGVREGDAITPYYDSMIGKLIVYGDDRAQALARLDSALAQLHIVGLHTNVQFLRFVTRCASFSAADLDTALITREQAALFGQRPLTPAFALAAALAHQLLQEQSHQGPEPFSQRDGWRIAGPATRAFSYQLYGESWQLQAQPQADTSWVVSLAQQTHKLRFARVPGGDPSALVLELDGHSTRVHAYQHPSSQGPVLHLFAPTGAAQIALLDSLAHNTTEAAHDNASLAAPMPGKVISFSVKPGERVRKGQVLALLEAMKMEHSIVAPQDGTVTEWLYAPGDQVQEGAALLKLGD